MAEVTGIKEIIKPENLVYRKQILLTDNTIVILSGMRTWNCSQDTCRSN